MFLLQTIILWRHSAFVWFLWQTMFALFLLTSLSSHSSSTVKLNSRYFKHEDQKLFKGKRQTEEEYLPGCPFPATDFYLFLWVSILSIPSWGPSFWSLSLMSWLNYAEYYNHEILVSSDWHRDLIVKYVASKRAPHVTHFPYQVTLNLWPPPHQQGNTKTWSESVLFLCQSWT